MAFCEQCGKSIPENSVFCPECGAHVEPPKTASSPVFSDSTEIIEKPAPISQSFFQEPPKPAEYAPPPQPTFTPPPIATTPSIQPAYGASPVVAQPAYGTAAPASTGYNSQGYTPPQYNSTQHTPQQLPQSAIVQAPAVSVKNWVGTYFLSWIPFVGGLVLLICQFVWAFSESTNPSKKTWAKAMLLIDLIFVIIGIILVILSIAAPLLFGGAITALVALLSDAVQQYS